MWRDRHLSLGSKQNKEPNHKHSNNFQLLNSSLNILPYEDILVKLTIRDQKDFRAILSQANADL